MRVVPRRLRATKRGWDRVRERLLGWKVRRLGGSGTMSQMSSWHVLERKRCFLLHLLPLWLYDDAARQGELHAAVGGRSGRTGKLITGQGGTGMAEAVLCDGGWQVAPVRTRGLPSRKTWYKSTVGSVRRMSHWSNFVPRKSQLLQLRIRKVCQQAELSFVFFV